MGIDKEHGYVLIITLLALVALTIAGMGAMMVASSDIQLSGNQRTQISARVTAIAGITSGMSTLCSNSFLTASHYTGTGSGYITTPPSQPQASFYPGLYSTPVPTNTSTATHYTVGYNSASVTAASPPKVAGNYGSAGNVSNSWIGIAGGGGGGLSGFYMIGPMIGLTGAGTKMECEQGVYYGMP